VAALVFELPRVTTTPPLPAADVKVTVPVPGWPPITVLGLIETLLKAAGTGLIVKANVLLTLASEAVSVTGVEELTPLLPTMKVAAVEP
jgi:hypothetical protein